MELAVISPPGVRADEGRVVAELFRHGLRRYHLRKPGWTAEQAGAWMEALEPRWRGRVVVHGHGAVADRYGADGHNCAGGQSRACHSLAEVRAAAGSVRAILLSPVYESSSKPGRRLLGDAEISVALEAAHAAGTLVFALSGVTAERVAPLRQRGFDGVAVLGAIWDAADPLAAFRTLQRACRAEPVQCLTSDEAAQSGREVAAGLSHVEQVRRLCGAGAKWIQLRMKRASDAERIAVAREAVAVCRAHGAILIVNDRLDVALAADADGAHLGAGDGDWREARRQAGPGFILGGTVNDLDGARRAVAAGCLDYVGVGPVRFTTSKERLAPVLGVSGVAQLIAAAVDLPAWAIGGVVPGDAAGLRAAGAAGMAVTAYLYRGDIASNYRRLVAAWHAAADCAVESAALAG